MIIVGIKVFGIVVILVIDIDVDYNFLSDERNTECTRSCWIKYFVDSLSLIPL